MSHGREFAVLARIFEKIFFVVVVQALFVVIFVHLIKGLIQVHSFPLYVGILSCLSVQMFACTYIYIHDVCSIMHECLTVKKGSISVQAFLEDPQPGGKSGPPPAPQRRPSHILSVPPSRALEERIREELVLLGLFDPPEVWVCVVCVCGVCVCVCVCVCV